MKFEQQINIDKTNLEAGDLILDQNGALWILCHDSKRENWFTVCLEDGFKGYEDPYLKEVIDNFGEDLIRIIPKNRAKIVEI